MSILPFLTTDLDSPERKRPREEGALTQSRVGSLYSMPLDALGSAVNMHIKQLTMCPIDPYGSAEPFDAYVRDAQHLHVPRFYGLSQWGPAATDETTEGDHVELRFEGELSAVQREAVNAFERHIGLMRGNPRGGVVVLPCGYGKTVFALHMAARLGRRTLVLVHKSFLVEQWQARARQFLPGASLGIIQQATVQSDADVVVGMVQSIAKRQYPPGTFDGFGFVVIDEAHHMAAPIFSQAMHRLPARVTLALSATPERKDGLDHLLRWSMGDICFRVARNAEVVHVHLDTLEEDPRPKPILTRDGRPNLAVMINRLARNKRRNERLAQRVAQYCAEKRKVIVMGDRVEQLKTLDAMLAGSPASRGFYIGKSTVLERTEAEGKDVIFTTFSMAREALDIPALDTLVMATPAGNIEQSVGRILRKHSCKQTPTVYDLLDDYQPFLAMRSKRLALYRKERYVLS